MFADWMADRRALFGLRLSCSSLAHTARHGELSCRLDTAFRKL